jgi:hypothetical protein
MTATVTRRVAILIFDDVEVLDFCGPFEVFGVCGRYGTPPPPFEVFTVAESVRPISARNGLSVNPRYALGDCPPADILLVPGGWGTRREMYNARVVETAKRAFGRVDYLVNSAATSERGSILDTSPELFDRIFALNVRGPFFLMQDALRLMIDRQLAGSIIDFDQTVVGTSD